jgi:hypothetical protein
MHGMFRPINRRAVMLFVVLAFGVASQALDQAALSAENEPASADSPSPDHLAVVVHKHSVRLSWGPSTPATKLARDKVTGYNVYRSQTSHDLHPQRITFCTGTTYTDPDVKLGTVYFYVVRGLSAVAESASSNEARAEIPPK